LSGSSPPPEAGLDNPSNKHNQKNTGDSTMNPRGKRKEPITPEKVQGKGTDESRPSQGPTKKSTPSGKAGAALGLKWIHGASPGVKPKGDKQKRTNKSSNKSSNKSNNKSTPTKPGSKTGNP
jgi:hypothetical protein